MLSHKVQMNKKITFEQILGSTMLNPFSFNLLSIRSPKQIMTPQD